MKILVLSDHISKDIKNGTWEFTYKFSKYASEICDVSVVSFRPDDIPDAPDFEQDGNLKIFRLKNTVGIKHELRKIDHDFVFIQTVKMFAVYMMSMGFKSKPIVSMVHGTEYLERLYSSGKKDLKYYALRIFDFYRIAKSDVLMFASKYMMDNSVRNYRAFRKSTYLPLGIDKPSNIAVPAEEKNIQKMILGDIKSGYKILFCIRRIVSRTGVLHLAEMMDLLRDKKAKLYIGGTGSHLEALKRKVEELQLSDRVIVMGLISDELKNWIYEKSYLSLVPTRTLEGFCLSMLESMNYGCPPVVTPVGGMYEFMKTNDLLELVTPGISAEQMEKTVRELLDNSRMRDNYAKRCKTLSENYYYPEITKKFIKEISYMLEKAGKSVNFKDEVDSANIK